MKSDARTDRFTCTKFILLTSRIFTLPTAPSLNSVVHTCCGLLRRSISLANSVNVALVEGTIAPQLQHSEPEVARPLTAQGIALDPIFERREGRRHGDWQSPLSSTPGNIVATSAGINAIATNRIEQKV